jgi:hypothetical protein
MIFRSENRHEEIAALFLAAAGVLLRLLPHPANFTPVMAVALFSGVALPASLALWVPLLVMIASDLVIGPHPLFWLVWGCFLLTAVLGVCIRPKAGAGRVFLATLAGSVIFFVVTNLGVFLFQDMYPKNISGVIECYVMALPFFRNTLLGDLFFSFCFFSVFFLAKNLARPFVKSGLVS